MHALYEDLASLVPYVVIALIAYFLRFIFARRKMRLSEALIDILAAMASGAFVGAVISIYPFPSIARVAIAGMAGFIGPDFIAGLLAITKAFKDSPERFILQYIYAFRGIKTGMDTPFQQPLTPPKPQSD